MLSRAKGDTSLIRFPSCSAVQGRPPAPLPQQHPQGPHEDPEDEHRDRDVLHHLLDSLLHAGLVVLALPGEDGGDRLTLAHPHALHIRSLQRLPRPHHLRPLHRSHAPGPAQVLPGGQPEDRFREQHLRHAHDSRVRSQAQRLQRFKRRVRRPRWGWQPEAARSSEHYVDPGKSTSSEELPTSKNFFIKLVFCQVNQ